MLASFYGIKIDAGPTNMLCNVWNGLRVCNTLQTEGACAQAYGIVVPHGGSNHYVISSNVCNGNMDGGVLDNGTGSSKSVANNVQ